jgi:hypothetical protein
MTKRNRKEGGFIVSLELVFIATCLLCIVIIGWASLGSKLIAEFGDLGSAVGSLNQSFSTTGMAVGHPNDPNHPTDVATWAGSVFVDTADFCDQNPTCGVRFCIPPTPEAP